MELASCIYHPHIMIDLTIPLAIFDAHEFFLWFMDNADLWFVFIFMIIESSFIPFPSELVVPPAAYVACTRGDMNIFAIIAAATAGAIVGALVNYYLAMWVGRPIVYRFADSRIAHSLLITREKVDKAESYFDRHGAISTFLGRLTPVVRQLISIPAGLSKMNIGKFVIYTGLGAGIWNGILAALGWWLGTTVPRNQLEQQIEKYNSYLSYGAITLVLLIVAYMLWKGYSTKKNNK